MGSGGKLMSTEDIKKKLQAGQHKRQAIYANSERELFLREAKKECMTRFFEIIKKYNISEEDISEMLEISEFLL
jgi:hypothetical protein